MPWIRCLLFAIVVSFVLFNMRKRNYFRMRQLPMFHNNSLNENGLVRNGIYWSDLAESFVPKGLTFTESMEIIRKYTGQVVKNLTRDSHSLPWRKRNAFITFEDGTQFYVKYRPHLNVYAEVFYFNFTRLLQIDNVPPAFHHTTNTSSVFWKEVAVNNLNWKQSDNNSACVIYIVKNIGVLKRFPKIITDAFEIGDPVTSHSIGRSNMLYKNPDYIAEIVQFGSMVLIDFLAMHTDRYSSLNVTEEKCQMRPVPNNIFKARNGKLWNIDNEGSFFMTYFIPNLRRRLLLEKFYDKLLKSICVFQSSLVESLKGIFHMSSHDSFFNYNRTYKLLQSNFVERRFSILKYRFKHRLAMVLHWIKYCKSNGTF